MRKFFPYYPLLWLVIIAIAYWIHDRRQVAELMERARTSHVIMTNTPPQ